MHWRRGVFLRHPIAAYASEALLELRGSSELAVEVRAPSPDLYFNVLRDSIEDLITRRWPGLDYHLFIPCPGNRRITVPGQFPPRRAAADTRERPDQPPSHAWTAARSMRSRPCSPVSPRPASR